MTNCDKESIKTLVVLHGQRKAARIAGLSENTVKSWALRYHWNKLPKPSPHPAHPIRTQSPAAIVADELSQNKSRSTISLSRYAAGAAEAAAAHPDKLEIAPKVRDVAAVYRPLWPERPNPNAILNVAILTGARRPRRLFDYDQNGTAEKQVEALEAESPHEPIAAKTEEKREVTWESRDTGPALDPVPQPTPVEIAAQVKRQKEAEYRETCRHWRRHT